MEEHLGRTAENRNINKHPELVGTRRKTSMTREELHQLPHRNIGDKMTLTADERIFTIREVLLDPAVTLLWTWASSVDPRTKERRENTRNHSFYRIEIIGDDRLTDDVLTTEDIFIIGHTLDQRGMMFPLDKYNEVLVLTQNFQHLVTT